MSTKIILSVFLGVLFATSARAAILEIDGCAGQVYSPSRAVTIVRGRGNLLVVRGDGVDRADPNNITLSPSNSSITVFKGETSGAGGRNTFANITFTPTTSGPMPYSGAVNLHIIPFGTLSFNIILVDVPSISAITISPLQPVIGKEATLTLQGTKMATTQIRTDILRVRPSIQSIVAVPGSARQFKVVFKDATRTSFSRSDFFDSSLPDPISESCRTALGSAAPLSITPVP